MISTSKLLNALLVLIFLLIVLVLGLLLFLSGREQPATSFTSGTISTVEPLNINTAEVSCSLSSAGVSVAQLNENITTCINFCLVSASASKNCVINFAAGNFALNRAIILPNFTSIVGSGRENTKLYRDGVSGALVNLNNASRASILSLSLDGRLPLLTPAGVTSNLGMLLEVENCRECVVSSLEFTGGVGKAVLLRSAIDTTISNNLFNKNGYIPSAQTEEFLRSDGLVVEYLGGASSITDNTFTANTGVGLHLYSGYKGQVTVAGNNMLANSVELSDYSNASLAGIVFAGLPTNNLNSSPTDGYSVVTFQNNTVNCAKNCQIAALVGEIGFMYGQSTAINFLRIDASNTFERVLINHAGAGSAISPTSQFCRYNQRSVGSTYSAANCRECRGVFFENDGDPVTQAGSLNNPVCDKQYDSGYFAI